MSAIVVTHAGPGAMLARCLDALHVDQGVDALIVVDNSVGSAHGRTAADLGSAVDLTVVVENHGFGAAVNAGIAAATRLAHAAGDERDGYYAVFNDDVVVDPGWLEPLLDEITGDDQLGAVQPKMLYAATDPAIVNSVGVELDACGAGTDIGMGERDGAGFAQPTDIAMFSGGAVLLSSGFIDDLGGFDERYFLYYEDVDLALRGAQRGWRFRCVPASTVRHEGSATTSGAGDEIRRLQERNRLWVAFRFGSAPTVGRALWLSIRRLRHAPRAIHWRALAAGLGGAPGRLIERIRSAR